MNSSLEHDLIKKMLIGDLDIAFNMVRIDNLTMAADALANALNKINQLKALAPVGDEVTRLNSPAIDIAPCG
jgi:hypothetical protein